VGAEQKLYQKLKKATPKIIWNRVENISVVGMPDLLGYNTNCHFFTVELKVTKGKKIKFSPHQISFHVTHPKNSFILVQALGPCTGYRFHLYRGSSIMDLVPAGLQLDACCLGLDSIRKFLYQLGAWRLQLGAWSLALSAVPAGVLQAWRLKLGASFFPRGARHNILGGEMSLVLAVWYIFNFFIPAISTIAANISLLSAGTRRARCHHSTGIWPAGRCFVVHHRGREPNHQVAWRPVEMVLDPCFTCGHPVTLRRC